MNRDLKQGKLNPQRQFADDWRQDRQSSRLSSDPARSRLGRILLAPVWKDYFPFFLSYFALLAALGVDLILLADVPFLSEGPPLLQGVYLFRSILVAVTGGLLVWGFVRLGARRLSDSHREGRDATVASMLPHKFWKGVVWLVWLLSAIFLAIFLISPKLFHWLSWEDRPIEMASAALYFVSAGLFALVTHRAWAEKKSAYQIHIGIGLFFVLGFLIVGFEEVSWMQRIFGLDTPAILKASPRDELNLHNLATDLFENIFYFAFFLFALGAPFINCQTRLLRRIPGLRPFVPPIAVVFVAALAMAFNYDMWNVLLIQLGFFITLAVLVYFATTATPHIPLSSLQIWLILGSLVLFQVLFILYGYRSPRPWDVTEYKEFLIPLALAVYSFEIFRRFRRSNIRSII